MPEYAPLIELIPSFKLIKRKSLLSEYRVGSGRLMLCGLKLEVDDPAAKWMKNILLEYLEAPTENDVPSWSSEKLRSAVVSGQLAVNSGKKIDAGGRPID